MFFQGIIQYYVDVGEEEWKFDTLCDIFMGGLLSIKLLSSATQDKKYARVLKLFGLPISYADSRSSFLI